MKIKLLALMFYVVTTAFGQTNSSPDYLDLNRLTLKGSTLKELTIEKVTNILGRPSAINKNELISDVVGPNIYYHSKGLKFGFKTKKLDSQQRVSSIVIYLVRTWDKEYQEFFYPFPENIFPYINANMKTSDILPLFKDYNVSLESAEARNKKYEKETKEINEVLSEMGKHINADIQHDVIIVRNNNVAINLFCEELTKYLEYVSIIF